MTDVTIIRHKLSGFASSGGAMPVADGAIMAQQKLTASGASQEFTNLVAAGENECWTVVVTGGSVVVKFGPVGVVATATDGWPLADGTMKPFAVPKGWSAAVING